MRTKRFIKLMMGVFFALLIVFVGLIIPSAGTGVFASSMIDVTNYPAAVRPAPRYCLRANDDPILKPEYYYNSDESQIAFCIEPTRSSPYQDKVDALKNQWNSIPRLSVLAL